MGALLFCAYPIQQVRLFVRHILDDGVSLVKMCWRGPKICERRDYL